MNRKERRAAAKRAGVAAPTQSIDERAADARRAFDAGHFPQARTILQDVLTRAPAHVDSLNLFALIEQSAGRHQAAIRLLKKAIAADTRNAASHYNIGLAYQAVGQPDEAATHFSEAIALGLDGQDVSRLIVQNPAVGESLTRIDALWPARPRLEALFGTQGAAATVAGDVFLRCALEITRVQGATAEKFLTALRYGLLQVATDAEPGLDGIADEVTDLCAALAQQCFINEYVSALSEDEERRAAALRGLLQERLDASGDVPPFLLAVVAAYTPLHALPGIDALLERQWPRAIERLLRQQVREPREEAQDRATIPSITSAAGAVSAQVRQQYEENPYPRWTILPRAAQPPDASGNNTGGPRDILIAGCGTGLQSVMAAQAYPDANILAVDISLTSLAYARRKTREAGVRNIAYAHADIMHLGALDRRFDVIEAIGVLHHLADPNAGWRVLLSLLRPGGEMVIGLYSATGRRGVNAGRALVKAQGYPATAAGIRACRQDILRREAGMLVPELTVASDFYAMSECRDLLFHVMEHQFTIADIKAFLAAEGLTFLGFELDDDVIGRFESQFGADALTDLDAWAAFEAANPQTFLRMYVFHVRKAA